MVVSCSSPSSNDAWPPLYTKYPPILASVSSLGEYVRMAPQQLALVTHQGRPIYLPHLDYPFLYRPSQHHYRPSSEFRLCLGLPLYVYSYSPTVFTPFNTPSRDVSPRVPKKKLLQGITRLSLSPCGTDRNHGGALDFRQTQDTPTGDNLFAVAAVK